MRSFASGTLPVSYHLKYSISCRKLTSPQIVTLNCGANSIESAVMARAALERGLNIRDASELLRLWEGLLPPHSIVTSPPYLDMHDYGNSSQIGTRGQSVEEYLSLMFKLFEDCYRISTTDATFWLVAGSVRRNDRLILLPELLASTAEDAGWTLRESITWDKTEGASVDSPWTV